MRLLRRRAKEGQEPGSPATLRLSKLAARIQLLAEKDERAFQHAHEISQVRQRAAGELYRVCASFTASVNALLPRAEVQLDPPNFQESSFSEDGPNLFQLNIRGRLLQIEFEATPELVSTEDFRIPYTIEGAVRSFNQEWLDRNTIDEQLIFYCIERGSRYWRFFDARTYRSGPFDQEYLTSLLERLI